MYSRFEFRSWLSELETSATEAPRGAARHPPPDYETVLDEGAFRRVARAASRRAVLCIRYRDHQPRLHAGGSGRRVLCGGRGRGRLRPARALLPRRSGAARARESARGAAPAPGRPGTSQDRPEPQVRHERARQSRHPAPRGALRHHARVLRPGQHRHAPRHGRARAALPRPPHHPLRGHRRQGRGAVELRPDPDRAGRALRGGRRGGDASPARDAVAAPRRRALAPPPLRGHRDASRAGALEDRAPRRPGRRPDARTTERGAGRAHGGGRARGARGGGSPLQPRLAEADPEHPLRPARPAGAGQDPQGTALHRGVRAPGARPRLRPAPPDPRAPRGLEAALHLHRRAARPA